MNPPDLPSASPATDGRLATPKVDRHAESEAYSGHWFGYLRLELRPDGYDWRFAAEPRSFTDSGSATCQ